MSTIVELREALGWNQAYLAKQSGLTPNTVRKAETGEVVSSTTARMIAESLSRAYGRLILVKDLDGLNVSF